MSTFACLLAIKPLLTLDTVILKYSVSKNQWEYKIPGSYYATDYAQTRLILAPEFQTNSVVTSEGWNYPQNGIDISCR